MAIIFRLAWVMVGTAFGLFLGTGFAPVLPLTLPLAWLLVSCSAALYVEIRKLSLDKGRERQIEKLEFQIRAKEREIAQLELRLAQTQVVDDAVVAEHEACKHSRVSGAGSNGFVEQLKCKDCKKLLFFRRKHPDERLK